MVRLRLIISSVAEPSRPAARGFFSGTGRRWSCSVVAIARLTQWWSPHFFRAADILPSKLFNMWVVSGSLCSNKAKCLDDPGMMRMTTANLTTVHVGRAVHHPSFLPFLWVVSSIEPSIHIGGLRHCLTDIIRRNLRFQGLNHYFP